MASHISHAGLPYPVKNARFTVRIAFRVVAGTPTDPTTPDTEISTDGGATFTDCTEEITTGGGNGLGFITLTATEMNNTTADLAAKSANCTTSLMLVTPRNLPILQSGTAQAGAAGSITLAAGAAAFDLSGCIVRTTGGTGGGSANNQARVITAYNTSTKVATVLPTWETNPSSDTTYDILLTEVGGNAVTGVAPTTTSIATAVWTDTTAGDFIVASSIGKSLYTSGNVPGAASGLQICGTNAATTYAALTVTGTMLVNAFTCTTAFTVTGATVHTGAVSMAAGLTITQSVLNGNAVTITGNGAGSGVVINSGATGDAIQILANARGVYVHSTASIAVSAVSDVAAGMVVNGALNGVEIIGGTGSYGLYASGDVSGIYATGATFGISAVGSIGVNVIGTGLGLQIAASSGPGVAISGDGISHDIELVGSGDIANTVNIGGAIGNVRLSELAADGNPCDHGGTPGASTATFAMDRINLAPAGGADGFTITTTSSGSCFNLTAGSAGSGVGILINASDTAVSLNGDAGPGLSIFSANDKGINVAGATHDFVLSGDGKFWDNIKNQPVTVTAGADPTTIGGQLNDGSATVSLLQLIVNNPAGNAIDITAAGGDGISVQSNQSALVLYGSGTNPVFEITAGFAGADAVVISGDGSGRGLVINGGAAGDAVVINATGANGIAIIGNPGAWGIVVYDGGVSISDSGGAALVISGTSYGMLVQGNGSLADIQLGGSGILSASLTSLEQSALAEFFTVDSGQTYGSSAPRSVVKEIADNATVSGDVTVGGYAAGQDPATLVMAAEVETGFSMTRTMRIIAAATAGLDSGSPGSPIFVGLTGVERFRGTADNQGDRLTVIYAP